jgi:hypothetical protein
MSDDEDSSSGNTTIRGGGFIALFFKLFGLAIVMMFYMILLMSLESNSMIIVGGLIGILVFGGLIISSTKMAFLCLVLPYLYHSLYTLMGAPNQYEMGVLYYVVCMVWLIVSIPLPEYL